MRRLLALGMICLAATLGAVAIASGHRHHDAGVRTAGRADHAAPAVVQRFAPGCLRPGQIFKTRDRHLLPPRPCDGGCFVNADGCSHQVLHCFVATARCAENRAVPYRSYPALRRVG